MCGDLVEPKIYSGESGTPNSTEGCVRAREAINGTHISCYRQYGSVYVNQYLSPIETLDEQVTCHAHEYNAGRPTGLQGLGAATQAT